MDMEPRSDVRHLAGQLVAELEEVRERGLDRLDGGDRLRRKETIPLLEALASHYAETHGRGRLARWRQVRLLVEAGLQQPEAQSERSRLEVLFGLRDGLRGLLPDDLTNLLTEQEPKSPRESRETAAKRLQRKNLKAREVLARSISSLFDKAGSGKEQILRSEYVRRDSYHEIFAELVENGTRLVILIGQAGMGKSWLAAELIKEAVQAAELWLRIRVMNGQIFVPDLRAALLAQQIKTPVSSEGAPELLASLLCDPHAPRFVLLDNLETSDELRSLLPTSTKSMVVATCRSIGQVLPTGAQVIRVGRMTEAEALASIEQRLPEVENAQASQLARFLYGYPLVIRYACALIQETGLSIRDFCADLRRDVGVVEEAETEEGNMLSAVLRRVVDGLAERAPLGMAVLADVCFLEPLPMVPHGYLRAAMVTAEGENSVATKYARAVRQLQQASLVEVEEGLEGLVKLDGVEELRIRGGLSAHPLTRRIIKQLYAEETVSAAARLTSALIRFMRTDVASFSGTDAEESVRNEYLLVSMFLVEFIAPIVIDGQHTADFAKLKQENRGMVDTMEIWLSRTIFRMEETGQYHAHPERWVVWARERESAELE